MMAHIVTNDKPADLATKIIYSGQKRSHLVSKVSHDIYDGCDNMVHYLVPLYVFDGFVRVPQPRKVNTTDSYTVITGQLAFCDLDPWGLI